MGSRGLYLHTLSGYYLKSWKQISFLFWFLVVLFFFLNEILSKDPKCSQWSKINSGMLGGETVPNWDQRKQFSKLTPSYSPQEVSQDKNPKSDSFWGLQFFIVFIFFFFFSPWGEREKCRRRRVGILLGNLLKILQKASGEVWSIRPKTFLLRYQNRTRKHRSPATPPQLFHQPAISLGLSQSTHSPSAINFKLFCPHLESH